MTVASCTFDGWASTGDTAEERTYTLRYLVVTDDSNDGPKTVLSGAESAAPDNLPALGSTYAQGNDTDATAYLQNRSCQLIGEPSEVRKHWRVECSYSNSSDASGDAVVPANETPVIAIEYSQFQKALTKDVLTEKPITNSANQAFDPPVTIDETRFVLVVSKNHSSVSLATLSDYQDSVNSTPYLGFAAKTLKLNITVGEQESRTVSGTVYNYRAVTYRFSYNPDPGGWKLKVLDQGYYEKTTGVSPEPLTPILDDQGNMVASPWLLNGSGVAYTQSQVASGSATFLEFDGYKLKDFNALGIVSAFNQQTTLTS